MGKRHGRGLQLSLINMSQKKIQATQQLGLRTAMHASDTPSSVSFSCQGTVNAITGSDASHLRLRSSCEILANHPAKQVLGQTFVVYFPSHASVN